MRRHLKISATLFTTLLISPAVAQTVESKVGMATDAGELQFFTENPAIGNIEKFNLSLLQAQSQKKYSYKLASDFDPTETDASQVNKSNDRALGLLAPIGAGAALGLTGHQGEATNVHDDDFRSDDVKETFKRTAATGRFVIALNSAWQGAFALRYAQINNDVVGGISVGRDDRTEYKGALTGFSLGVFYRASDFALGAAYLAPMRGKAKAGEEEFIVSEPGLGVLDGVYGGKDQLRFGFAGRRWFYKADDRTKKQESPEDEREMSLNGLDLEQWQKPTQELSLGVDSPRWNDIFARLALSQIAGVWQFEPGNIPGDEPDDETKFTYYRLKVGITYDKAPINVGVGYQGSQKKTGEIDGSWRNGNWFSDKYEDYSCVESVIYLTASYAN